MGNSFVHEPCEAKWSVSQTEGKAFENVLALGGRKNGFRNVIILNFKLVICPLKVKNRYKAGPSYRVDEGLDIGDKS